MKKNLNLAFAFALVVSLFISGCSSDGGGSGGATISSFTVAQSGDKVVLNYATNSTDINHFEFSYTNAGNTGSTTPGSGEYFITTDLNTTSKKFDDLSVAPGEIYNFSVRVYENNGYVSPWFGVRALTVASYCSEPFDLSTASGFSWSYNTNSNPTNFQVQYGAHGFSLGSGTTNTTTEQYFDNSNMIMHAGSSYDFYVRSYCSSALGYSSWVGPSTMVAASDYNVLMPPNNIGWNVEYNFFGQAVGATFNWLDQGGNHIYDCVLVPHLSSPNSVAYSTVNYNTTITYTQVPQNTDYDFYIRTVCVDGTKTSWVGPLWINIGS